MFLFRTLSLSTLITLVLATSFSHAQGTPATPVAADRIIAIVNNDVITAFELSQAATDAKQRLIKQGTSLPEPEQLQRHVLERMIMERIQLQSARETNLRIDDQQLDQAVARIAQTNKRTPASLRETLEKEGTSWSTFREEIRKEMILSRLRSREVDQRVVVSEAEVDHFIANTANTAAEEYDLSHILLRIPEQAGPEDIARLRARIEDIAARANRGTDFAQLAAAYSEAPDALSGGNLGARPAARLPVLFAEAAAKMNVGDLSPVLRSPAGFHIVKLNARRGGAAPVQAVSQTRVRHILIKVNEMVSEADARRRIDTLQERLTYGRANFAELAKQYSNDGSAPKGGDLGWISPGETVPDFEAAMNALKIGVVSAPVRSPFGWHLIEVLERREDASQERQRAQVRKLLHERKSEEAYQDWLRQIRDRAYVEYRLEER